MLEFGNWVPRKGEKWQPRKVTDSGRALLVKSGRLRKSIRLTRVTQDSVTIGSNVSYAPYHNFGSGRLPQRQFVGGSTILNRRLQRMIRRKIIDALSK